MTRARTPAPVDHAEHRDRWAGLISDIHAAVAADDRATRDRVWDRAGAAISCWTMPAAYPRGMTARLMAQAALTWSRQTDPAVRATVTPILMQTVGLCDELLSATLSEGPGPEGSAGLDPTRPGQRLPYADA